MLDVTAEQFAQRAFDLNLIDQRQLESVWSTCGTRNIPTLEFQNILLRNELLTNYQIERLLKGEKSGFFYGSYKVLYLVGTGSFARVYRAVHKETGQVVAVKVLRKRWSDNPIELEKFLREGQLGSTLRHPNIVPILEVHSERRAHFLVMEFVEGQSLREFLKIRRQVSPLESTEILAGIMSGLAYAAEKGITHRDLKLSNVLISSDARPQLVDFGLAAMTVGPGGDSFTNARTIDYAGLEKVTGVKKDDPRSDIFFAGCMYYQLMAGTPPLPDTKDKFQRMNMARFREIKPIREHVPDLPLVVENILRKSMSLNADERYSKPVEMMVDLQKAKKALQESGEKEPNEDRVAPAADSKSILLVETSETVQDALRTALKKNGFRVLVISDPARAVKRLQEDPHCADCVILSVASLGKEALSALAAIRKNNATQRLPAMMLFGKSQAQAQKQIKLGANAVALAMPLKMADVRQNLAELLK